MGAYRILAEDFVEAAAAGKKLERLVEDQEWLGSVSTIASASAWACARSPLGGSFAQLSVIDVPACGADDPPTYRAGCEIPNLN